MNFNQIQVGGSNDCPPVTTTSSSTYTIETPSVSEKGWECPRCHHINAPWVRQCDCDKNNWYFTWKEATDEDE